MADTGLPQFLVIGAMKAGTTRLHAHFAAHRDIGVPRIKETDFFVPEVSGARDLSWYRSQFPKAPHRGEVSPNYAKALVFPGVPERIAAALPDVRLIYLMRDPVARGLSEYRHKCAAGYLTPGADLDEFAFERLLDPGLYHRQLLEYLRLIPQDRVLCLTSEKLASEPEQVLTEVARFLRVEDIWPDPTGHDNSATAALPGWYWRMRNSAPGQALRRHLPSGLAARLRRAAMRPVGDTAVPPGLADRLRERSTTDSSAMRALTGLQTPNWSC